MPRSRLLALWTRSGWAANSSMPAASMASWRFCARSASRSSRHRWQRKSPASRWRYAHLRQPPSAVFAARLRRQLAARRSRHFWHERAHSPLALTAHGRVQRRWQHRGGFAERTAGGTKPGGVLPLHWAMRVERSMVFSVSGLRRGSASVPERAARARRAVTSRERGRSVRRTRRVDRASTRDTLAGKRRTRGVGSRLRQRIPGGPFHGPAGLTDV